MHDDNDRLDAQNPTQKETTEQTPDQAPGQETEQPRRRRGFAAMDPKLVSELASRGGKAAQRAGTAHRFNSEEARVAGRKGGQATGAKRRAKSTSN